MTHELPAVEADVGVHVAFLEAAHVGVRNRGPEPLAGELRQTARRHSHLGHELDDECGSIEPHLAVALQRPLCRRSSGGAIDVTHTSRARGP